MKYIESTPLPDGTYDHTEVRAACRKGCGLEARSMYYPFNWFEAVNSEHLSRNYKYRAQVPDTYGIHESSSTLREVKGDAGPAVAEMLLDRISEVEKLNGEANVAMLAQIKLIHEQSDRIKELEGALNLALEYWTDRQQRYKNRSPVWVEKARAALNKEPK